MGNISLVLEGGQRVTFFHDNISNTIRQGFTTPGGFQYFKSSIAYIAAIFRISVASVSTAAARFIKFDNNTTTSNRLIEFEINNGVTGSGQVNANGANTAAFGTYSDERLKENIVPLTGQLDYILSLKPKEFDYISNEDLKVTSGHQIGFLAQDVKAVCSDAVGEDDKGYLTLTGYSPTDARIIAAIQELHAIVVPKI